MPFKAIGESLDIRWSEARRMSEDPDKHPVQNS